MAKIREYDSQVNLSSAPQGGPRASGEVYGAGVGRSIRQFGQEVTQGFERVEKRKYQNDVSTANASLSEVQRSYTEKWDEAARTANPGDTEFYSKFMENFDNDISKTSEGIQTEEGRQYFQETAAKLRDKFNSSGRAVQAELAGIKAKNDYTQTKSNLSSILISDPSSFDLNLDIHNKSIDGLVGSGLLPGAKSDELKQTGQKDLAEAAVKGWIKQDPLKAKNEIHSGKWDTYLDGSKKYQLVEESEREIISRKVEKERNEALAKKVKRESENAIRAEFQEKIFNYSLTAKEVMDSNLPATGGGSKKQFIDMIRRQAKADVDQTDPVIYGDIFNRIHADASDPDAINDENDLMDYSFGNGLSQDDVAFLSREIRAKKVQPNSIESKMKKNLFDQSKKKLTRSNGLTGYVDEGGEDRVHKFSAFMQQEYETGIKNGKTPMDLLDPQSPNYLGKFMPQFQKSDKEIIGDIATETKKKEKVNGFNSKQKEAYNWALKNKNDPRSKEILKRLGAN
jgi:hypothetical protein